MSVSIEYHRTKALDCSEGMTAEEQNVISTMWLSVFVRLI